MDNEQKAREILEYCYDNLTGLNIESREDFMKEDIAKDMIEQIKFLMEND